MRAREIRGAAPGGTRTRLADVLPLDTPLVLQVFPVYACNFKCHYCIFSVPKKDRHFISDRAVMPAELYRKCVGDMTRFPQQIKVVRFVGIGEPLLHRNIADMVEWTVSAGVARTVEILTNGAFLTPALSDALIRAGLTRLVVSLQGTTPESYRRTSGIDLDFGEFIANLRYFFEHKGPTEIYIKIIDCALTGKEDEERFFGLFGDLCDSIGIEHAVPIHSGVDFKGLSSSSMTQFGLPVTEVGICPQPFYTMQVNPDGKVVPCYSFEYPAIMGDASVEALDQIWSGASFHRFRRLMLDGTHAAGETCANCTIIKYRLFPEDRLNDDASRLKRCFEA